MLREIVLALCVSSLCFPSAVYSQSIVDNPCLNIAEATRGKDNTQTLALVNSCRSGVESTLGSFTPEAADKWSSAAKGFGEAIGIAARELGIASNEFLSTPAGILLAVILLFTFAGGALIGFPFTIFSMLFWWYIYRRVLIDKTSYQYQTYLWGAFTIRRVVNVEYYRSEYSAIFAIVSGFAVAIMNLVVWANVT